MVLATPNHFFFFFLNNEKRLLRPCVIYVWRQREAMCVMWRHPAGCDGHVSGDGCRRGAGGRERKRRPHRAVEQSVCLARQTRTRPPPPPAAAREAPARRRQAWLWPTRGRPSHLRSTMPPSSLVSNSHGQFTYSLPLVKAFFWKRPAYDLAWRPTYGVFWLRAI